MCYNYVVGVGKAKTIGMLQVPYYAQLTQLMFYLQLYYVHWTLAHGQNMAIGHTLLSCFTLSIVAQFFLGFHVWQTYGITFGLYKLK